MSDFKKLMKALDKWLNGVNSEYDTALDQWLGEVRAEAWDEGYSASETSWRHVYEGHPVPEGEKCPECSIENPYRQE